MIKNQGAETTPGKNNTSVQNTAEICGLRKKDSQRNCPRLFHDAGIELAAIMGYSSFVGDVESRRENERNAEKMIEVARDIDCPVLRLVGGTLTEVVAHEVARNRGVESLKRLALAAETAGVSLALETHDAWTCGADCAAVVAAVASPAVGICWDVGNTFFCESPATSWEAAGKWVKHVHFKDARRRESGRIGSVLPGTGEVDLPAALALLYEGGYTGYLSFEWEKKWEAELEEPEIAFPHFQRVVTGLMAELGVPRG